MATEWYMRIAGAQLGPFSPAKLRALAQERKVKPDTLVKKGEGGKWVRASNVKGLFEIGPPAPPPIPQEDVLREIAAQQVPTDVVPQQVIATPTHPATVQVAPGTAIQVNVHDTKVAHSLGIGSVVLGFVGLLTFCVPIVSVPSLLLGLALGIVAIVLAATRKGSGIGFGIAGTAMCGLILIPTIIVWYVLGTALNETARAFTGTGTKAEQVSSTASDGASREEWIDASEMAATLGDVRVSVTSVEVDAVAAKDFMGNLRESQNAHLQIHLTIDNLSESKKVEYDGWSGNSSLFSLGGVATLKDNFDNSYKRVTFGYSDDVVGQVTSESIYPGKDITDLIIFETPVDTAEYLRLELPGEAFGGEGYLRFQIPASMIRRRN